MRRRTLLAAAGAGALGSALSTGTARADSTITVDPSTTYGTWEGWGTSLAWWANVFGASATYADVFADLFFTDKWVTYQGASRPGLNLDIARYNLGACGWNAVNGSTMAVSPNIPWFKQIEGYWQDPRDENPASTAWNWDADRAQRTMLLKAVQRGAHSELFANSPMWWMCKNRNPSGAAASGTDNLAPEHYRRHALHLATVAQHARDAWGVDFVSVEPFNEPSSGNWRADFNQEGCYMSRPVQAAVLPELRRELDRCGLTATKIAASDEATVDTARATWAALDASAKALVDRVNVHGYQGAGGSRALLHQAVVTQAGKGLWNSETGTNTANGFSMAMYLLSDLHALHPTAWAYWQPLDPHPDWAMFHYTPAAQRDPGDPALGATLAAVNTKYYVMAHFSRHIRPGMKMLHTGVPHAAAAWDETTGKLVIVVANDSTVRTNLTFDLSGFSTVTGGPGGVVPRWNTGVGERYVRREAGVTGKSVTIPINTKCVQTLEIDDVRG
ncbi:glycoside hydrolase [Streptomyces sp. NPDC007984]|uniref:glycoside hydrolase n=1 Tax=Streptomyces sp. NPDC007984 TaxID=3364801 RepID=UPI0036ED69D6